MTWVLSCVVRWLPLVIKPRHGWRFVKLPPHFIYLWIYVNTWAWQCHHEAIIEQFFLNIFPENNCLKMSLCITSSSWFSFRDETYVRLQKWIYLYCGQALPILRDHEDLKWTVVRWNLQRVSLMYLNVILVTLWLYSVILNLRKSLFINHIFVSDLKQLDRLISRKIILNALFLTVRIIFYVRSLCTESIKHPFLYPLHAFLHILW